ncbi:unnamed protein product [Pylaiella littoralis]
MTTYIHTHTQTDTHSLSTQFFFVTVSSRFIIGSTSCRRPVVYRRRFTSCTRASYKAPPASFTPRQHTSTQKQDRLGHFDEWYTSCEKKVHARSEIDQALPRSSLLSTSVLGCETGYWTAQSLCASWIVPSFHLWCRLPPAREHGAGDMAFGNANSNVDPDKEDIFRAISSPASQGRHGDTILDNI